MEEPDFQETDEDTNNTHISSQRSDDNSDVTFEEGTVSDFQIDTVEGSGDVRFDIDSELLDEELTGAVRREVMLLVEELASFEVEVDELQSRVETLSTQLEKERDEFKSYKQQREERMEEERNQYIQDVFTGIIDVHANMYRGLATDHDTVRDVKNGFELTFSQLEDELQSHGVEVLLPEQGESVTPEVHDIIGEVTSETVAVDSVARVHTPGYSFNGDVIKPAKVIVSAGPTTE